MKLNFAGRITEYFINSQLTVILMAAVAAFGVFALMFTPREENPQIVVPAANIFVMYPGGSAREVEELVAKPLERILREIKGVEHVYSMSMNSMAVVTVRYKVGEDRERSLLNLYNKVMSNIDYAPPGAVLPPLFKPIEVDDVPIVEVALSGGGYDDHQLKLVADGVMEELAKVPGTSNAYVVGGRNRQVMVELDPVRLAAYGISPLSIQAALSAANVDLPAGGLVDGGRKAYLEAGGFLGTVDDVAGLAVGSANGGLVYLRDVAEVTDTVEEPEHFTRLAYGPARFAVHGKGSGDRLPGGKGADGGAAAHTVPVDTSEHAAVVVAVAKKKGENAVTVARNIIARMDELKVALPPGVDVNITRNDGEKANHAVNELVEHLFLSIFIVVLLLFFALGWRDALIVALAIPLTLFVTLGAGMLAGQTINRITLFALTLSLGLLVDDAIVVVENMHRHYQLERLPRLRASIQAVNEIGSPTVLATLTVILAFLPMSFVTGMMGPYMAPIPFNVPVAMLASLMVAFIVTPWAAYRLVRVKHDGGGKLEDSPIYKTYNKVLGPLLQSRRKRRMFLAVVALLFAAAMTFPLLTWVKFRMLPKADNNTFLVTIDMPAGTALEGTDRVARAAGEYVGRLPEVKDYESYVGVPAVTDFNGLLRGSGFRAQSYYADIRVNISDKKDRKVSSEELVLKIRPDIDRLARQYGANIKIVEEPPGPPVRSTVLAELYGPDYGTLRRIAGRMRGVFGAADGVVDIDDSVEADAVKYHVVVDKVKASANGISTGQIVGALRVAMEGAAVTTLHVPDSKVPIRIFLRYPRRLRSSPDDLRMTYLTGPAGQQVPLSELVRIAEGVKDKPVYHKDLKPVVYVYGEMAGRSQLYAVLDMMGMLKDEPLPEGYSVEWDGEMKITMDVFRDLGAAMGVALLLIYLLLVGRFRSFSVPIIIMGPIPLAMIGIMPGFALLGVYFSATSMIGVIALAGIVVRNSIILIEFIQDKKVEGMGIERALIEAGAIRTRPIVLTALAAIFGASVIAADPVWSGLAWALIFGMTAATALTLVVIPVLYYVFQRKEWEGEAENM
ncbi:MAG: efflux RND transporter permease subunit [Nitrospirae bacterium]|nr:efflux RND transporter permease subunit [Nitrospirota bacterium]